MSEIIVDGGIASNYPNWIYLNGGVNHFHSEFVDASRIKIGFSVDDKAEANPIWAVDDVIEVSISDVLKKIWNGNSTTSSPITTELSGIVSKSIIGIVEAEINNAIDEFMYVQLLLESNRKEAYIAKMITSSLNKSDGKFYTVEIPVAQFNWLDFEINSDKEKLDGIAQRGWHATLEILREKRLLSVTTDNSQCPFSI